jgi:tetratricopeptide (TPR) repeat protein
MKKLVVILFAFFSYSIFAQETEKRLALVIGNANYDKGELKNPVNDARLIASTLDSLNFDVILRENVETQTDFKRAILEFGKKRPSYDVAFVYYAGHGVQINDENYLLPTREEFSSENEVEILGVSVQDVMTFLRSQTNEVNILILDACRDNPFESNWNTTRSLESKKGLAKIPPPTGSLIAFSTDSGQTAPDGDGDNSIYTESLAKNMLLEDTSIDQVFRNVRAEVYSETDGMQRPVEATQLTGETFYLNPTKVSELLKDIQDLLDEEKYDEARSLIEPIYSKNSENIEVLKLRFKIFIETDKNTRALEDINRFIEIKPNNSWGYRNRADLYAKKLNDYEKAEADYTKAIELEPENDENYYYRGNFYNKYLEDYDKAIKDLSKAIELDPEDLYNYFYRGNAFGNSQQYNRAIADYLKSEELDKDQSFAKSDYLYNNIALTFEYLEQYDNALAYYTKEINISPDAPIGYRNRADLYAKKLNDYEKAEADYTKAIELEPENDENYYSRGNFYNKYLEDYDKAIKDLSKAIELDPEDLYNYFDRGNAFGNSQQYNRAIADYLKIEELDKDQSFTKSNYIYNNLAVGFQNLKQIDKALEYYTKEINLRPNSSLGYRNRADLYAKKLNDYEKAEADYTKAIELEPENDENYYYRGNFYNKYLEDYDKAIKDLSKAIELDPEDLYNYFYRGNAFGNSQQYNRAIADYLKSEELDKDQSFAKSDYLYNNIALTFEYLEQYDNALAYYTKEINISPDAPIGYRNRADLYAKKLNDYEKAEADYTKAIELEPENDENYYSRGNFYNKYLEDYDKAIKDLSKAIELDPEDLYNYFDRGNAFGNSQQYNRAIADYLKIEELDKDQSFAKSDYLYNNIALTFEYLEQYDNALAYYTKEINISPDAPIGYRNRADLYAKKLNDYEKAEADYTKAIELEPENDENYYSRGIFYADYLEDYDKAIKDLSKAIELDPEDPYNYFYRGENFYSNKQYNNAITDYLKAIEINNEIVSEKHINLNIAINYREIGDYDKALSYYNKEIELKEDALSYSERAIFYYSFVKDVVKAGNDFKKALSISPDVNNIILKYINFLKNERKYDDALKLIKENNEIDTKDPQPDFVAASIYFDLEKPYQAVKYLGICLEKIKKYSSEGYWISDVNDNKIDLCKPFVMMGNFFKGKDAELMCDYYADGLNYTEDEKMKNEINTLIADNCN